MSTEPNPYASPTSDLEGGEARPGWRPKSPKVIGILSIVFGALGLLSGLWNVFAWSSMTQVGGGPEGITVYDLYGRGYMVTMTVVNFATSVAVLIAGFGLVTYRRWGRYWFLGYAVVVILLNIGNAIYIAGFVFPRFPMDNSLIRYSMYVGAIGGAFVGCLFPVICSVFLFKRRVVESLR